MDSSPSGSLQTELYHEVVEDRVREWDSAPPGLRNAPRDARALQHLECVDLA